MAAPVSSPTPGAVVPISSQTFQVSPPPKPGDAGQMNLDYSLPNVGLDWTTIYIAFPNTPYYPGALLGVPHTVGRSDPFPGLIQLRTVSINDDGFTVSEITTGTFLPPPPPLLQPLYFDWNSGSAQLLLRLPSWNQAVTSEGIRPAIFYFSVNDYSTGELLLEEYGPVAGCFEFAYIPQGSPPYILVVGLQDAIVGFLDRDYLYDPDANTLVEVHPGPGNFCPARP